MTEFPHRTFAAECYFAGRLLEEGTARSARSCPGMDRATKFRKRAQRWEERAATAIDAETRERWQRVAEAWDFAAQAAERTPPLIWQWERERWRDDEK